MVQVGFDRVTALTSSPLSNVAGMARDTGVHAAPQPNHHHRGQVRHTARLRAFQVMESAIHDKMEARFAALERQVRRGTVPGGQRRELQAMLWTFGSPGAENGSS